MASYYYIGDMDSCNSQECKKRKTCYRAWLHEEQKRRRLTAWVYMPEVVMDVCPRFIHKDNFKR